METRKNFGARKRSSGGIFECTALRQMKSNVESKLRTVCFVRMSLKISVSVQKIAIVFEENEESQN